MSNTDDLWFATATSTEGHDGKERVHGLTGEDYAMEFTFCMTQSISIDAAILYAKYMLSTSPSSDAEKLYTSFIDTHMVLPNDQSNVVPSSVPLASSAVKEKLTCESTQSSNKSKILYDENFFLSYQDILQPYCTTKILELINKREVGTGNYFTFRRRHNFATPGTIAKYREEDFRNPIPNPSSLFLMWSTDYILNKHHVIHVYTEEAAREAEKILSSSSILVCDIRSKSGSFLGQSTVMIILYIPGGPLVICYTMYVTIWIVKTLKNILQCPERIIIVHDHTQFTLSILRDFGITIPSIIDCQILEWTLFGEVGRVNPTMKSIEKDVTGIRPDFLSLSKMVENYFLEDQPFLFDNYSRNRPPRNSCTLESVPLDNDAVAGIETDVKFIYLCLQEIFLVSGTNFSDGWIQAKDVIQCRLLSGKAEHGGFYQYPCQDSLDSSIKNCQRIAKKLCQSNQSKFNVIPKEIQLLVENRQFLARMLDEDVQNVVDDSALMMMLIEKPVTLIEFAYLFQHKVIQNDVYFLWCKFFRKIFSKGFSLLEIFKTTKCHRCGELGHCANFCFMFPFEAKENGKTLGQLNPEFTSYYRHQHRQSVRKRKSGLKSIEILRKLVEQNHPLMGPLTRLERLLTEEGGGLCQLKESLLVDVVTELFTTVELPNISNMSLCGGLADTMKKMKEQVELIKNNFVIHQNQHVPLPLHEEHEYLRSNLLDESSKLLMRLKHTITEIIKPPTVIVESFLESLQSIRYSYELSKLCIKRYGTYAIKDYLAIIFTKINYVIYKIDNKFGDGKIDQNIMAYILSYLQNLFFNVLLVSELLQVSNRIVSLSPTVNIPSDGITTIKRILKNVVNLSTEATQKLPAHTETIEGLARLQKLLEILQGLYFCMYHSTEGVSHILARKVDIVRGDMTSIVDSIKATYCVLFAVPSATNKVLNTVVNNIWTNMTDLETLIKLKMDNVSNHAELKSKIVGPKNETNVTNFQPPYPVKVINIIVHESLVEILNSSLNLREVMSMRGMWAWQYSVVTKDLEDIYRYILDAQRIYDHMPSAVSINEKISISRKMSVESAEKNIKTLLNHFQSQKSQTRQEKIYQDLMTVSKHLDTYIHYKRLILDNDKI